MATIYKCSDCGNKVRFGSKYCDECGAILEWPEEKKETIKKTGVRRSATSIKLPINPDNLFRIIVPEGSFLKEPIYNTVLFFFCFGGPILSTIISRRQRKIQKWLRSLETEECDLSIFREHIDAIGKCGAWAIGLGAGFIITNIIGLFVFGPIPEIYISAPIWGGIGIAVGVHIKKLTGEIIGEMEGTKQYAYEFKEESEQVYEPRIEDEDVIDDECDDV